MEEKNTVYFKNTGETNTAKCIELVKAEVEDNGYMYVIVASQTGETGVLFADALSGMDVNLMVVSYDDEDQPIDMASDIKHEIINKGATLFNAPALALNLNRAFGSDYDDTNPLKIVETSLSVFGQGMKVCCKSAMAAIDGGLVAEGIEVLCVAGTDVGADTVTIIRAMSSKRFKELKVREILARPR